MCRIKTSKSQTIYFASILTLNHAVKFYCKCFFTQSFSTKIKEDLYMSQPGGYVVRRKENFVFKLKKSLCGLKQSARACNEKINDVLLVQGFSRSKVDQCLYTNYHRNKWMHVLAYVDD